MGSKEIGGSLPPGVVGPLRGYIEISLDRVEWLTSKPVNSAVVRLNWRNVIGNTTNVYQRSNSQDLSLNRRRAKYAVRSQMTQLESYLTNVNVLAVKLLASKSGILLGRGNLQDISILSTQGTFKSSVLVTNDTGEGVANVTLGLKLEMLDKSNSAGNNLKSRDKTEFKQTNAVEPQMRPVTNNELRPIADNASDKLMINLQEKVLQLKAELYKLIQQSHLPHTSPNQTTFENTSILIDPVSVLSAYWEASQTKSFNLANIEQETADFILGNDLTINEKKILSTVSKDFSSTDEDEEYLSDDPIHDEQTLNQLLFASEIITESKSQLVKKKKENSVIKKDVNFKQRNKRALISASQSTTAFKSTSRLVKDTKDSSTLHPHPKKVQPKCINFPLRRNFKPFLLHCLLQIPSGSNFILSSPRNLYLVCRTFSSEDTCQSEVCWNSIDPRFNFKQMSPVQMTCDLLRRLQNNFMVIEVWEKTQTADKLFGICKLPVHTFYQSFRDEEMSKSLLKLKKPVVAIDGRVPIVNLTQATKLGDLHVFLALGTQSQMEQYHENVSSKIKSNNAKDDVVPESSLNDLISHVFTLNSVIVHLENPPGSLIWGESDCFVEYLFPKQTKHLKCDELCLCYHKLKPRLCEPEVYFDDFVSHIINLPKDISISNTLIKAYSETGMTIFVYCRYYYPQEHDAMVAKTFLSLQHLLSTVSMNVKSFTLKLYKSEKMTDKFQQLEDGKCIGEIKLDFCYKQTDMEKAEINNFNPNRVPNRQKGEAIKLIDPNVQADGDKSSTQGNVTLDITLEKAANLEKIRNSFDKLVCPSTCVSLGTSKNRLADVFPNSTEPVWNWQGTVDIPVPKLSQHNKCLVFNVWHIANEEITKELLLGTVTVNLNLLFLGSKFLSGWYNIIDHKGLCRGQIKLHVQLVNASLTNDHQCYLTDTKSCSRVDENSGPFSLLPSHIDNHVEEKFTCHKSCQSDPENPKIPSHFSEFDVETRSFLLNKLSKSLEELDHLHLKMKQKLNPETVSKGEIEVVRNFGPAVVQNNSAKDNYITNQITSKTTLPSTVNCKYKNKISQSTRIAAAIFK